MIKKTEEFFETYEKVFLKNNKKEPKLYKYKKTTLIILVTILFTITLIYILAPSVEDENERVNKHAEKRAEKYESLFPFDSSEITQPTKIDKTKPIHVLLNKNNLIINNEYLFEISGKTDIHSEATTEWSVLPDLNSFPTKESMLYVQAFENGEYLNTIFFSIHANLVNGFELFLDLSSGSDVKLFEEEDIDSIQNGYLLEHKRDIDGFIGNLIYKYYIFPDGTGILIYMDANRDIVVKRNEIKDMKLESFKEKFKKDLAFMNETVPFSKL